MARAVLDEPHAGVDAELVDAARAGVLVDGGEEGVGGHFCVMWRGVVVCGGGASCASGR